jgi:hypothetical protein
MPHIDDEYSNTAPFRQVTKSSTFPVHKNTLLVLKMQIRGL